MNFSQKIINLFKEERISELILVPNSEILYKKENKLIKCSTEKLTSKDIQDTLFSFVNLTKFRNEINKNGTFSVSLPGTGRISIYYLKQRGSFFAKIRFIPYHIPELINTFQSPIDFLEDAKDILNGEGIHFIKGKDKKLNSLFMYSFLKLINQNFNKIIFVVEDNLSYLLEHGSSVIIQQEINEDISDIKEGFSNISILEPDITYINTKIANIIEIIPLLKGIFSNRLIFINTNLEELSKININEISNKIIEIELTDDKKIKYSLINQKVEI